MSGKTDSSHVQADGAHQFDGVAAAAMRGRMRLGEHLVNSWAGREAVSRVLRKAKADRVGTAIADLTVCGAVPPYNEILGGKLVALLMASPQVAAEYRRRYGNSPSVIASSMAGRAVRRAADLVFIGTTSLYGRRPCQYDRIRFDWDGRPLTPGPSPPRGEGSKRTPGPSPPKRGRGEQGASIRYL